MAIETGKNHVESPSAIIKPFVSQSFHWYFYQLINTEGLHFMSLILLHGSLPFLLSSSSSSAWIWASIFAPWLGSLPCILACRRTTMSKSLVRYVKNVGIKSPDGDITAIKARGLDLGRGKVTYWESWVLLQCLRLLAFFIPFLLTLPVLSAHLLLAKSIACSPSFWTSALPD